MTIQLDQPGKIVRNTVWLSSVPIIRLVIGFFVTVQVIRYLGPEQFGIYSYVVSIISLLVPLTGFGLEQITVRELVSRPHQRNEIFGSALTIRLGGALLAAVSAIAMVFVLDGSEGRLLELVSLGALSLLFLPFDAFADLLRSREQMVGVALPQAASAITIAVMTLSFVIIGASLDWFIAVRAAETALLSIGLLLACTWFIGHIPRPRPNLELIGSFIRQGWPLLLSSFSVMIYMRINQIMLAQLGTAEALGQYAAAVRFAELFFFVPVAIATASYPDLVRAHQNGVEDFSVAVQRYSDVMISACYGLLVLVLVGGTIAIVPLLGERYAPSVPVFHVLAGGIVFVGFGVVQGSIMTIRGWLWTYPVVTLSGAAANVLLNALLIPRFGAVGAAWATLFSYWLSAHGMGLALPWLRPTAALLSRSLNPIGSFSRLLAGTRS